MFNGLFTILAFVRGITHSVCPRRKINSMRGGGMTWTQTGATQYHAHLGLPDKGCAIKGLVVCNNWDLEPLDLLNGLVIG